MKYSRAFSLAVIALLSIFVVGYGVVRSLPVTVAIPVRPPEPPENSFLPLTAASSRITLVDEIGNARLKKPRGKKYTLAEKCKLVEANRDIIAFARRTILQPYLETNTVTSIDDESDHYKNLRSLTRLLVLTGDVAWESGDTSDAVNCYLDAVTLARNIPNRTGMLGLMTGLSCEIIGRSHLWKRLDEMDGETAERCLRRLNALAGKRLPLYVAFEEEKYSALSIAMDAMSDVNSTSYAGFVPKRYVADTLNGYMDKQIALAKNPYSPSDKEIPHPKEIFTAILAPAEKEARLKYAAVEAGDVLMRTALAVRVFEKRTGKPPKELSELVTMGLLPSVPDDPLASPGTSIRYSLTDSGAPQIYSVGPDAVDNGGRGIAFKATNGKMVRGPYSDSKGDMVAGWYTY